MKKLSFAYFGSAYFSALLLEKLINDSELQKIIDLKLVVTQPDKPVGRKQILTPTPVKEMANKYHLPVLDKLEQYSVEKNLDFGLVYAYGEIIPKKLLELPKYGFLNVHPSLLPKYRGTSPIAGPLINDEKQTGVTIIKMDEKVDHGPVIAQEKYEILPADKRPDLEIKLTELGYKMLRSVILNSFQDPGDRSRSRQLADGMTMVEQNHSLATYTKKLTKQDGFIEFENLKFSRDEKLFNLFRGLYPWPGIWTILPNGKRLKITDLDLKDGKLLIKKVQMEGKKEVGFETFNSSYKFF